jgi:hypothetical protein
VRAIAAELGANPHEGEFEDGHVEIAIRVEDDGSRVIEVS